MAVMALIMPVTINAVPDRVKTVPDTNDKMPDRVKPCRIRKEDNTTWIQTK